MTITERMNGLEDAVAYCATGESVDDAITERLNSALEYAYLRIKTDATALDLLALLREGMRYAA